MYDTQTGSFQVAGACPSSHPVRMPQVAYETLWDTSKFASMWPSGTPNPFVLSYMGKDSGLNAYGSHADYVFGWKGDALQRAMDSGCMFQGCENGNPLKSQSVAQMNACNVKPQVTEDIDGCRCLPRQSRLASESRIRTQADATANIGLTELPGMGGM